MRKNFLFTLACIFFVISACTSQEPVVPSRGATPTIHPIFIPKTPVSPFLPIEIATSIPELVSTPSETANQLLLVPILMYHHIDEIGAESVNREFYIHPDDFHDQIRFLSENDFQTINLSDLHAALTTGKELPANPIILTFDDGYQDQFDHAFPILEEFGFSGTFFIIPDFVEEQLNGYMTWENVEEMFNAGMQIELHGDEALTEMSSEEMQQRILETQAMIAANLNDTPQFYAYPFGQYDQVTIQLLNDLGFLGALTTNSDLYHTPEYLFEIPRLFVAPTMNLSNFEELINTGFTDIPVNTTESPEIILFPVFDDMLNEHWDLEASAGSSYNEGETSLVQSGTTSLSFTGENEDRLIFQILPQLQDPYLRENVIGISFWLNAGENEINVDDLLVEVFGSNTVSYWVRNDTSAIRDLETYSGHRLYGLGLNDALDANSWVQIEILLNDLVYDPNFTDDPIEDPFYTYVTGFSIQFTEGYSGTIYLDDVQLLVLK